MNTASYLSSKVNHKQGLNPESEQRTEGRRFCGVIPRHLLTRKEARVHDFGKGLGFLGLRLGFEGFGVPESSPLPCH